MDVLRVICVTASAVCLFCLIVLSSRFGTQFEREMQSCPKEVAADKVRSD